MKSIWLMRVLALIQEMDEAYKENKLDYWDHNLLNVLKIVRTCYWFAMIDDLKRFLGDWRVPLNSAIIEDSEILIELAEAAEAAEKEESEEAEVDF